MFYCTCSSSIRLLLRGNTCFFELLLVLGHLLRGVGVYRGVFDVLNPHILQSHHNHHPQQHQLQHPHQQQNSSSQHHQSGSEFVRSSYFQQQSQYMMTPENGCHYRMAEVGQPEDEEDSPGTPKKRGRKKKIKVGYWACALCASNVPARCGA